MMVLCNANAIIEYARRGSGLPSAPLDMEHDNNIMSIRINSLGSKHHIFALNILTYNIITYTHGLRRWQANSQRRVALIV